LRPRWPRADVRDDILIRPLGSLAAEANPSIATVAESESMGPIGRRRRHAEPNLLTEHQKVPCAEPQVSAPPAPTLQDDVREAARNISRELGASGWSVYTAEAEPAASA
jgi:hypothetical protein